MSDRDDPASYDLGRDFWKVFVRRHWGRRPTVIRQPFARAIASPADVFGAMVAATDRLRTDTQDFVLTIDGVRVGADVERWLPRKKDRSLDRLTARIAGDLPGSSFAVFIRAFQLELGWEFWLRVRRFLRGLYGTVGVPADCAEIDLFAGTYERTRRGIHLDSADVFLFVIEGRKRIRLWPRSVFPDRNYWYGRGGKDRRLSRSICLDGDPGDILYWPSSYWHVGESRGGPVSSLSLGLYQQDSLAATAARVLADEATRELGSDNFIDSLPSSVDRLRAASPRALRALDRASDNLALALLRRRMEQVTGYAFEHVPQPSAPSRVRASSYYAADPAFPIFCRSVGDTTIVAANGRSIALPRSKAVREAIDSLNRGTPISLSQRTGATHADVREALRFLLVSGGVELTRAADRASGAASRAR
jgi:50S ribosomal protein L16 3-hydroxylase